jgi:mannan endo-1,4-beta-mannosidase
MKIIHWLLLAAIFTLPGCQEKTDFVTVSGTHFKIGAENYYYLGTNFWYGLNLASKGKGGDRARLTRELDRLKAMGVTNLRIMAASEGPDTEPYRMVPALQTAPGIYNEEVLDGLDFLLQEMRTRNMYAIVCLSNFWNWSGGMGQYIVWANAADAIPYPPPHPDGDWGRYQEFTAQFYTNPKAVEMLDKHISFIVNRKNPYSNVNYKDDPTIMAWQLCNEPRGIDHTKEYTSWIENTSALIKKLDSNHLVTIGSEGTTSSSYAGTDPEKDHSFKNIDYMTIHIWVQNWNIYDPKRATETYDSSIHYALDYIDHHEAIARKLNKPLVLEEFGISRDSNSHDASSSTRIRDRYYASIFNGIYEKAKQPNSVVAGVNFWAWGGEGRPREPECIWKPGDDFIGDPPHETQGWYSVYDRDAATNLIIQDYALKIGHLKRKK